MSTHAPRSSGVSPVLISWRCICPRGQLGCWVLCNPPPPLRPTEALRPAQGTYSVTFACTFIYTEAWSRFPYCTRVGNQALSRASFPSEAVREYVDWFRVCSHPFLLPGEGPNADFSATDSRVGYVSVFFICFLLSVSIT